MKDIGRTFGRVSSIIDADDALASLKPGGHVPWYAVIRKFQTLARRSGILADDGLNGAPANRFL